MERILQRNALAGSSLLRPRYKGYLHLCISGGSKFSYLKVYLIMIFNKVMAGTGWLNFFFFWTTAVAVSHVVTLLKIISDVVKLICEPCFLAFTTAQIFTCAREWQRLCSAHPIGDGGPRPTIFNNEHSKIGVKFGVLAVITLGPRSATSRNFSTWRAGRQAW